MLFNKEFNQCNQFVISKGLEILNWQLSRFTYKNQLFQLWVSGETHMLLLFSALIPEIPDQLLSMSTTKNFIKSHLEFALYLIAIYHSLRDTQTQRHTHTHNVCKKILSLSVNSPQFTFTVCRLNIKNKNTLNNRYYLSQQNIYNFFVFIHFFFGNILLWKTSNFSRNFCFTFLYWKKKSWLITQFKGSYINMQEYLNCSFCSVFIYNIGKLRMLSQAS